MIKFVTEVTKQFKEVIQNSHYNKNRQKIVTYPYLTFKIGSEYLENAEGFYVDADIFDMLESSTSKKEYNDLFTIEKALKEQFKKDVMLDDLFIRFNYVRANEIDTKDDLLIRRNLQFYCKVYWRDR